MSDIARPQETQATFPSYLVGFGLSILLTLAAFVPVQIHVQSHHQKLSHHILIPLVGGLALAQFMVQMLFFLHLGRETKPRWKLLVLVFMVIVVAILVIGSLWIMYNLNYNMLSPMELNTYLHNQDGL